MYIWDTPHTGYFNSAGSLFVIPTSCSIAPWQPGKWNGKVHLADCWHRFSLFSPSFIYKFLLFFALILIAYIWICSPFLHIIFRYFLSSQLAVFRSLLFTSAEEQVQRSMVNNFRVQQAVKGRTVRSSFTPFLQDAPSMK